VDLTTPTSKKGKLLVVESLRVVYVPLAVAQEATPAAYDAANLASLLHRLMNQFQLAKAAYAEKTVQRVANSLEAIAKGITPIEPRRSTRRRLYAG
jgi:hypothetical protein